MRKVYAATALCAVAIVAVAAATGAAAKGPVKVHGKVGVLATPTSATDSKGKIKTTSVTVTGKLKTQGTCLGGRKIEFIYVTPAGSYSLSETATSARNGKFTATLPAPVWPATSKTTGSAVTLSATAVQVNRKDTKSGQKAKCLEASGIGDFTDYA
jgi:hypothetical protein